MKAFLATWTEYCDLFEEVTYTYLVIANTKEEATEKIRAAKAVSDNLKITECDQKDGIVYVSAR